MRKICFLTCHNLYDSKHYFTEKLAQAFQRQGIETALFTWPYGPVPEEVIEKVERLQPDLTCSFHQLPPQTAGGYFWDMHKQPHWTILVDPAFYDLELMQSPFSIISCVDRTDCELMRSYHFENVFFWPHAIERELIETEHSIDRPYDVIMLGTCYDPDHLRAYWRQHYPAEVSEAIDDAVEIVLSDNHTSFFQALILSLATHEIDPHEVEFDQLAYYVDSYARGIDRIQLIRSIRDRPVHVFGDKCWREEQPIKDWSYYLGKQHNVTLHPPVSFSEALQLLKRSKICLNSMPFFKNGSHERIFAALACGALPLTSDNLYIRDIFQEGQDLYFYQFTHLDQVNDLLLTLDDERLATLVASGQAKVRQFHTWDSRVDAFLRICALPLSLPLKLRRAI